MVRYFNNLQRRLRNYRRPGAAVLALAASLVLLLGLVGPATSAELDCPGHVAVDNSGNF